MAPQSWPNRRTRRPQMAHQGLSRPQSRNQYAQIPQPNDPWFYAGSAGLPDGKLRERDLGRDLEGAKITLHEYLDRWLETAVKPRVRDKTYQDYERILCRYVRPSLGARILAALRPLDLQTTYQQMTERGLSARTVRYAHAVLRSAMRQAVRWRLLLENPADGIRLPQQPRREMRALTVVQARAFLETTTAAPYGQVLAVALTTGMRPSEYLGLKWQDIDWARQTVSVVRGCEGSTGDGPSAIRNARGVAESLSFRTGSLLYFARNSRQLLSTPRVLRPLT
jgi:integrase